MNKKPTVQLSTPTSDFDPEEASTILKVVGALIIVFDRAGHIISFNRACEETTGYTQDEVLGRVFFDFLLPPEDVPPVRIVFAALSSGIFPNQHENDWLAKDGTCRRIIWSNTALLDASGDVHRVVGTGLDITERIRAEELSRQFRDALERRIETQYIELAAAVQSVEQQLIERHQAEVETLEAKAEIIRQREEFAHGARVNAMGELVSALVHEVSQPLTSNLNNAETALNLLGREGTDRTTVFEILQDISTDSRHAAQVVGRVKALLRREAATLQLFSLNDILRDAYSLLEPEMRKRAIQPENQFDETIADVQGDPVQILQVTMNLLLNACDAMNQTPLKSRVLTVRTSRTEHDSVLMEIQDSGHGIAAEHLESIFETFFTTKQKGMGMGLSISRSIIKSHGGRLWAENNAEGGAILRFSLPMAREREETNG